MSMSKFKEKLFLRVPAFHKYLTNICYIEIHGPHPKIIVPALVFQDFIENGVNYHIIRTKPEVYGDRRYPLYYVVHGKLYTRTLREVVNGIEDKALDKAPIVDGKKSSVVAEGSKVKDEEFWNPLTIAGILKRESYSELFHPSGISLMEQLKLMAVGWAFIELAKWFLGRVFVMMGQLG